MYRPVKLSHIPPRLAAGVFVLNSGLAKLNADEATAAGVHGMAAGAYPIIAKIPPAQFTRMLSLGEIALGSALLIPIVPSALAGAGLTVFAAGLLGLYLRTPGMRKEGSLRPTPQGIGLAKDVWLLGSGLGLVLDDLTRDDQARDDC
jgi:hypothetical protein